MWGVVSPSLKSWRSFLPPWHLLCLYFHFNSKGDLYSLFFLFIYLLQLVLLPDLLFLFFIAVELLCNVVLVSATEKWVNHTYTYTPLFCISFPFSSAGKESVCHAGDPGSIPGWGRSPGEGTGYPLQYSWASLVAQLVKNLPAMWETWIRSLGWEDPLEKGIATHSSILACRIPWTV